MSGRGRKVELLGRDKTCFFIGHRDAPDSLLPFLITEVERQVTECHVREFVVGHYGNFDALAARAVNGMIICEI